MAQVNLPADVALTERSRKFYDGTYKWNSDGFTDDNGVYRAFDCYDPAARAPTPLPCMFLGDEEEGVATSEPREESVFTFASESNSEGELIVRCDELLRGYANREHLLGKMEGVLIASRANKIQLSLEECHRLCGITDPATQVEQASKRGITPPSSPLKKMSSEKKKESTITPKRSPPKPHGSSPSELSDYPSDLSEYEVSKQDARASVAPTRSDSAQQEGREKKKPPIGGVAQKAKKIAKKPAPKALEKETNPSLVVALNVGGSPNLGSSMEGSRRRSTRLGGGK